jgi:hypothetical protein
VTRRIALIAVALALFSATSVAIVLRTEQGFATASYAWLKVRGGYTVDERIRMHAGAVEARLRPKFEAQVEIVIAPTDFRRQPVRTPDGAPAWLPVLYSHIKAALNRFPSEG